MVWQAEELNLSRQKSLHYSSVNQQSTSAKQALCLWITFRCYSKDPICTHCIRAAAQPPELCWSSATRGSSSGWMLLLSDTTAHRWVSIQPVSPISKSLTLYYVSFWTELNAIFCRNVWVYQVSNEQRYLYCQIPQDDGTIAAPVLEVSELPASLPPISTPVITQPITEQVGITTSLFICMLFFCCCFV